MRISFTGAQSTGKTTLLRECCNNKFFRKYHCVKEVTRKVARERNVNINETGSDVTQLFILNEHLHNHHVRGDALLDRCIVDGWVYTNYLECNHKVSEWVSDYAYNMYQLLLPKLDIIFYTEPGDVPVEDDGQRSVDIQFRDDIIDSFENEMNYLQNCYDTPVLPFHEDFPQIIRLSGDVPTRMSTIFKTIKDYDKTR
jgi:predicted ATPase